MNHLHRLLSFAACAAVFAVPACQTAHAAETPRSTTPSVDVEVEDRAPNAAPHLARFNVSLSNGHADLTAADGDTKYALSAHTTPTTDARLVLKVKRSDFEVAAAIPQQPSGRILVAKIDRADGRVTTIVAQAR